MPAISLTKPKASVSHVISKFPEEHGMAFGISLVYSGNFDITCDTDAFGLVRLMAGISPDGFDWKLSVGEEFVTPEAVLPWPKPVPLQSETHKILHLCCLLFLLQIPG